MSVRNITHAVGIAYRTGLLGVEPVDDGQVAIVRKAARMGCWIALVPGRGSA